MPIVMALSNRKLKTYHWDQIKSIIGQDFNIDDDKFTLRSLMNMNVIDK